MPWRPPQPSIGSPSVRLSRGVAVLGNMMSDSAIGRVRPFSARPLGGVVLGLLHQVVEKDCTDWLAWPRAMPSRSRDVSLPLSPAAGGRHTVLLPCASASAAGRCDQYSKVADVISFNSLRARSATCSRTSVIDRTIARPGPGNNPDPVFDGSTQLSV
jgi:hypothetical protein